MLLTVSWPSLGLVTMVLVRCSIKKLSWKKSHRSQENIRNKVCFLLKAGFYYRNGTIAIRNKKNSLKIWTEPAFFSLYLEFRKLLEPSPHKPAWNINIKNAENFKSFKILIAQSLTAIVPGQLLGSRFLEYQRRMKTKLIAAITRVNGDLKR